MVLHSLLKSFGGTKSQKLRLGLQKKCKRNLFGKRKTTEFFFPQVNLLQDLLCSPMDCSEDELYVFHVVTA